MILGSRPVALWLNVGPVLETETDILSGNPIDRTIFIVLMLIGILILLRRGVSWRKVLETNRLIFVFLLFSGISVLWSDFQFVSFKRWIKEIGNLIMVLVIVTDPDPYEAAKTVIRRCAYVLIPMSVLLIKYYPDLGRTFDPWTGQGAFRGVATSKNMLGNLCLVCGLFFFWNLVTMFSKSPISISLGKREFFVNILFLLLISWLFRIIDSATSLICLIFGICLIIGMGFSIIKRNPKFVGVFIFATVVLLLIIQIGFNVGELIMLHFDRELTFTGRTELWKEVLGMVENPLIGAGYDSFWLGDRARTLWNRHWWHPTQAHNGYIETYLNLGLIGLFLLIGVFFSSYWKIRGKLMSNFDYGRLRMTFLLVTLVVNVTEGVFKGTSIIWFIFLLTIIQGSRKILRLSNSDE